VASIDRITVTLPDDLIREMDRLERNRSRFVAEAVRHELEHRRRQELRRSLVAPHPESKELAEAGFDEWARALPDEDAAGLVDPSSGTAVRWVEGEGWVEENA
jgi:Arc/MetJ-type ribon-helix-helix transcriptional regulator